MSRKFLITSHYNVSRAGTLHTGYLTNIVNWEGPFDEVGIDRYLQQTADNLNQKHLERMSYSFFAQKSDIAIILIKELEDQC